MNGSAPGISAAFLNAVEGVLERASGDTESGVYCCVGYSSANPTTIGDWVYTLSRSATILSVSGVDQAIAANHTSSTAIAHLTANGFQAYITTTAANTDNCGAIGNWTANY